MPIIQWNESNPQGSDSLGLGDDEIRSLKTSLRQGLDAEHVWPSGGGDAGIHRLGSARPFVGTQSLVSSTGSDGRLMFASDTSNFFHVGSGGTAFIGGARAISAGTFPGTAPQRYSWIMEFGTATTASNGSVLVSIPNSGYSGVPYVQATVNDVSSTASHFAYVVSKTATNFIIAARRHDGVVVQTFVDWFSLGSRVL